MRLKFNFIVFWVTIISLLHVGGPVVGQKTRDVFVDDEGVMRWGDSKKEVYGFGINYTVPFAHAYRSARKLNVDLEKAISDDVYHFSRLGFDAFRVHVWDTEISDTVGNIIENEHLRLFDFMLMKMKERGMKMILTPIAFWGNGYPDPDEKTPGFSKKYGKDACLVDEHAIAAQQTYLFQFLNHVNPYTKLAYKDDPDIVAFEVSNEPHHKGTKQEVTAYINQMVSSMRNTGCRKPIFYNISHSIHLIDAYFDANIDGGTFQWYPTGLVSGRELNGNFLPNVDRYTIPFANDSRFKKMAKMVYEFDAADIGRSYIYPAIARSFREAGIQWATHFSYDPTFMAYANTEYSTHYMNLVYAPQKALSLKIASEVFHAVPRYTKFGSYPKNTAFDKFRVSYREDLAEVATEKKFIYTNNTSTVPPDLKKLEEVSGFGNSVIVKYEGKGAYFLDRIESGIWRLEVLPDAIWVDNVFGRNSLQKTVAVINWREWPMEINVSDLGKDFSVSSLAGDLKSLTVTSNSFNVRPGVYLLKRKGVASHITGTTKWKNITIDEFAAPLTNLSQDYVLHNPVCQAVSGQPIEIKATVVTRDKPDGVVLTVDNGMKHREIAMMRVSAYDYAGIIPADMSDVGFMSYSIVVKSSGTTTTYPNVPKTSRQDLDGYNGDGFTIPVVAQSAPLYLFNANTDAAAVSKEWRKGSKLIPAAAPLTAEMLIEIPKLQVNDPEQGNTAVFNDYSLRYDFKQKIVSRRNNMSAFNKIIVRGRSIDKEFPLQVSLVDGEGNAFGGIVIMKPTTGEYVLELSELHPVKLVLLPRPYPTFLPYYFENGDKKNFEVSNIESFQVSIGPGLNEPEGSYSFALESVRLEL